MEGVVDPQTLFKSSIQIVQEVFLTGAGLSPDDRHPRLFYLCNHQHSKCYGPSKTNPEQDIDKRATHYSIYSPS